MWQCSAYVNSRGLKDDQLSVANRTDSTYTIARLLFFDKVSTKCKTPLEEAPLSTNCQRPLAPDVQITTADGMLSVTAEGQISIYDLTGTLRSSGTNALRMVSTTGETLLVVIQGGDTTLVRKVIVR